MNVGRKRLNIGIFVEYYPDTFKPYIDWQIKAFLKLQHRVTIYAHGAWDKIIDKDVIHYNLLKRVVYYPSTLRYISKNLTTFRLNRLRWYSKVIKVVNTEAHLTLRQKLVAMFRGFVVSDSHNVCLLNNLATASYFTFIKKLLPTSCVAVYYHGAPLPNVYSEYMKIRSRVFEAADVVIANSKYAASDLQELGCPMEKVIIVPVGLDLSKFKPTKTKYSRLQRSVKILSVGRLSPEKGFIYAIEAIEILVRRGYTNISYTIIGEGPQEAELDKKIRDLKLTRYVQLVGAKSNTEVVKYLSQSDIFLLPSVPCSGCVETQGVVIQEAQAMKLPVVATNIGGIPEGVVDGHTGLLVEPFNSKAIAEKLIGLISLQTREFEEYGENGRRFVETKYNIENTVVRLESYFAHCLKTVSNKVV